MTATLVLMAALVGCDGYGYGCGCGGYYGSYGYGGAFPTCGYSCGWLPHHYYSTWGDPSWYSGCCGGYSTCGYSYGWLPSHYYSTWGGPGYYPGPCCSGLPYGLPSQPSNTAPPVPATPAVPMNPAVPGPTTTWIQRAAGVSGVVVLSDHAPRPLAPEQTATWQRPVMRTAPLFTNNLYRTAGNGVQRPLVLTANRNP